MLAVAVGSSAAAAHRSLWSRGVSPAAGGLRGRVLAASGGADNDDEDDERATSINHGCWVLLLGMPLADAGPAPGDSPSDEGLGRGTLTDCARRRRNTAARDAGRDARAPPRAARAATHAAGSILAG